VDVIQPPIDMEDRSGSGSRLRYSGAPGDPTAVSPPIDMEDRRTGVEVASVSQVLQVIQLQCLG